MSTYFGWGVIFGLGAMALFQAKLQIGTLVQCTLFQTRQNRLQYCPYLAYLFCEICKELSNAMQKSWFKFRATYNIRVWSTDPLKNITLFQTNQTKLIPH